MKQPEDWDMVFKDDNKSLRQAPEDEWLVGVF
jgi:hypothetical protein